MVFVFNIHNKEIVSLCSGKFLWLLYHRQAYRDKQLPTWNILLCLLPLNHAQMIQHKTDGYFILGAKWQIFRHIMGQYFIETSTFSYNDTMGSEADCCIFRIKDLLGVRLYQRTYETPHNLCTMDTKLPLLVTKTDENKSVYIIQWHHAGINI